MPAAGILILLYYPVSAWSELRSDACGSDNAKMEKMEQAEVLLLANLDADLISSISPHRSSM
jgi:hypothetical protein